MATADSENSAYKGSDVLHDQCTGGDEKVHIAVKLHEDGDDLLFTDDQPGTSETAKTIDMPAKTSAYVPSDDTPKLQRTPNVKSTPVSMKFVKELLVKDHKIENREAEAAVITQGCDVELCLHWIERTSKNFTLLEERSKEFQYSCGIITKVEMMEWTVQHLMNCYKVSEGVAKATVLVKGTINLGECKRYAKIPNDPEIIAISEPIKEYQEKIECLKGKQLSKKSETSEKILDPYKKESLSNLSKLYGVQGSQATVLLNLLVLLEFDTCFKWILQHQYDDKKLQETQRIFSGFNFKHRIVQMLERSQCPDAFRKVAAEVAAASRIGWVHGFPDSLPVMCEELISSISHMSNASVSEILRRYSSNESLVHKQKAVICLCEFMSEMTAKAAVQAAGTSVYNCRRWAEENKGDNGKLQMLYDEEIKKYYTACDLMEFLIKETYFDTGLPEVKKTEWRRRQDTSSSRVISRYNYYYSLVESSLKATLSTDFDVRLEWIKTRLTAMTNTINMLVFCMETLLQRKMDLRDVLDKDSSSFSYILASFRSLVFSSRAVDLLSTIDEKEWHRARQRCGDIDLDATKTFRLESLWLLATAAIQATSSTEFDVCCKWITKNVADMNDVWRFEQRYQEENDVWRFEQRYQEEAAYDEEYEFSRGYDREGGLGERYGMSAVHQWRDSRKNVWPASLTSARSADKEPKKVPLSSERETIRKLVFCLGRVLHQKPGQPGGCRPTIASSLMMIQERKWSAVMLEYADPEYRFAVTQESSWQNYEMLAKAAIQATSSTNFDVCREWITANADDGHNVESLALQFNQERGLLSSHSYLNQNTFLRISKLKAEMTQKIGPDGGEIGLQECSLLFPEGALKEEKEFNVTLDNDPKKFPKSSIPITSILGCRPSMEFEKPVTVKMRTCYSAIGDAEITAALYQRKDESDIWTEKQKVTVTNRNEVQFDVMHFSDDVVAVSENASGQGEFHLINDVYIKKDTATIASIFFVDQGAHDLATKDMQSRGVVPMLMKPKEIIAKMGTKIQTDMQCRRPNGAIVVKPNTPSLKVTPNFLKKRGHEIYYELDSLPDNFTGSISIRYTLSVEGQVEETLPLATHWPIVLPEPQVLQQIGHLSIGARTNIRGNIVSAGQARTNLESYDAVYHVGTGSNSP